jgi:hypothetical protein
MERTDVPRVLIADQRANGSYLRASWHADRRVVVVSHWRGDVCTASTAIALTEIPKLISMLVAALAERPQVAVPAAERSTAMSERVAHALTGLRRSVRRALRRDAA